jgi:hypothetical protein
LPQVARPGGDASPSKQSADNFWLTLAFQHILENGLDSRREPAGVRQFAELFVNI